MQQESPSRRWLPWARRQWEPRAPRGAARLSKLEVECREALRTQWLSFPFDPDEPAARTLGPIAVLRPPWRPSTP